MSRVVAKRGAPWQSLVRDWYRASRPADVRGRARLLDVEEITAFYGNEDILMDEGSYVLVYGKDNTTERGKYLNVWRREGNEWKIYSNMWNANAPATTAK